MLHKLLPDVILTANQYQYTDTAIDSVFSVYLV